jgi:hypothetical protein
MATMKTPTVQGSYRKDGSINQGPPQGAFEDRLVARGGQSPLGNALARNVGGGGPGTGRDVYRSGANMTHGDVVGGYRDPPMDDLDRYYGWGRRE